MLLRFTKMHGLGNDFMVIDLVSQHAHIQPKHAKHAHDPIPYKVGGRHQADGLERLLAGLPPNDNNEPRRHVL